MSDKPLSEELKTTGRALALTGMDSAQALDTARFMEKQATEIVRLRNALIEIVNMTEPGWGIGDVARRALEDK